MAKCFYMFYTSGENMLLGPSFLDQKIQDKYMNNEFSYVSVTSVVKFKPYLNITCKPILVTDT